MHLLYSHSTGTYHILADDCRRIGSVARSTTNRALWSEVVGVGFSTMHDEENRHATLRAAVEAVCRREGVESPRFEENGK